MITQAWEHCDISVELYAPKLPLNYKLMWKTYPQLCNDWLQIKTVRDLWKGHSFEHVSTFLADGVQ